MMESKYNESLNTQEFVIKNNDISLVDDNLFIKNPISILKCIELSIENHLNIDEKTKKLIHENVHLLKNVSSELIYKELINIILSDDICYYMKEFCDLFFVMIPELKDCYQFNQYNDYHVYDVYEHTIAVVKNTDSNLYLRLAAIFHDTGKPLTFTKDDRGVGHFYGHSPKSVEKFNEFAKRYNLDEKTREIVSDLILYHQDELSKKNSNIYRFYKKFDMGNIELLFKLKRADVLGQNPKYISRLERLELLEKKYLFIRERIRKISYSKKNLVRIGVDEKMIELVLDDIKYKIITGQLKEDVDTIDKYVESKVLYKAN